jgi:hypothetical protein
MPSVASGDLGKAARSCALRVAGSPLAKAEAKIDEKLWVAIKENKLASVRIVPAPNTNGPSCR